jgi:uncharacterized protein YecE (DUF72 family)
MTSSYYIGCPVWSCPHWRGGVYATRAPKEKWLHQYSQTFNTVEGNSTFYGIPKLETIQRWVRETEAGFRFALKFPRVISHEKQLQDVEPELERFLEGLAVLHEHGKLGPAFLQLAPTFDPGRIEILAEFLSRLPLHFPYAVEVRHPGWFESKPEKSLNQLLAKHHVDRVIFDSRPLFSAPPSDEIEADSQRRKPVVPVRLAVTGQYPMLRLIGRNEIALTRPWIREWVPTVASWIENGLTPMIFTHTPDDRHAPEFARLFHNTLAQRIASLQPIEQWPFEVPTQKELF